VRKRIWEGEREKEKGNLKRSSPYCPPHIDLSDREHRGDADRRLKAGDPEADVAVARPTIGRNAQI
jgi:hypothetical protein